VEELKQLFLKADTDLAKPFIASCGSGVTAASLIFAAHLLGNEDALLYDGSWSEWGADPAAPKVVGAA
jgi:thiosulfate/3-mercaptopyruvate sulfurtransferase